MVYLVLLFKKHFAPPFFKVILQLKLAPKTVFQKRCTAGQETHEKMLNIINY